MGSRIFVFLFLLVSVLAIGGCYNKPVRHLASDVGLLKVGTSTQEDVLIYLGDPDEQQELGGGVEKWLYTDVNKTLLEKTPMVGKHLGSPEYRRAVVTLQNGIVIDCTYSASDEDDLDWADDYSWQEKKSD
jgi:hypothetical protein